MAQKTTFKKVRLFKILRELNISEETVLQYLDDEGFAGALKGKGLNASITDEDAYYSLYEAFASDGEIASRVREKRVARETSDTDLESGDGALVDNVKAPPSPSDSDDSTAPPADEASLADEAPPADEASLADEASPAEEALPGDEALPAEEALPADEALPAEEALPADEGETPGRIAEEGEVIDGDVEASQDAQVQEEVTDDALDSESEADSVSEEPAKETGESEEIARDLSETEEASSSEEQTVSEGDIDVGHEVSEKEAELPTVREETEAVLEDVPSSSSEERDTESDDIPVEALNDSEGGEAEEIQSEQEDAPTDDVEAEPTATLPDGEVEGVEEVVARVSDPVEEEADAGASVELEEGTEEEVEKPESIDVAEESDGGDTPVPSELAESEGEPDQEEAESGKEVDSEESEENIVSASRYKLTGTTVVGKIDLNAIEESSPKKKRKRKRKRKKADGDRAATDTAATPTTKTEGTEEAASAKKSEQEKGGDNKGKAKESGKKKKRKKGPAVDKAEVDQAYQETLRTLEQGSSRTRQRRRRRKRDEIAAQRQKDMEAAEEDSRVLRVTEFISTGELANLMDVQVNEVISTLFASGMMVSINQRLDADTISFVADEFNYEAEFITDFGTDDIQLEEDDPEDLEARAPVVTVMGHVDHGKTSLLDYLRSENVVSGEAGGITQHIGAYHVELPGGRQITFLDTPGHEAFTAMRARGAQVTDIVILVVAADDSVMPQTIEAINHAKAADVPIMVAINKMDKPDANAPRVMQELADHGVLVEQYGGQVQCSLVSAKTGENISELLEKVLLESDLLELKANPDRKANGVVIESRLDKGRGTVATILVQNGTLSVGDTFIAGIYSGRVRAMFDERDLRVDAIGPALPALVLGFDGAPEVGDQFVVMDEEREAREIAQKRQQIHREQTLRQRKHITLDEIGRRLALGDFRELNLIVKADVGGSVEALSDSLLKLSTEEVAVNIIHSGVGAITESDVMLASASDAVIIGFQVRPSSGARNLAEREEIDIRTYSIIYDAIEDVRDALEGLLSPEESEKITGGAEVRETFKVPKIGTVAGCYVTEGRIRRNDRIRLIRDGIVIYEGGISSLKRFKDDVREVVNGYECGIAMENYNDIKVGDVFEAFEIVETKRKLEV